MPGRKGVPAPQNSFLDTIATRFVGTQSCFLLGCAQVPGVQHIVYCSDGFCKLTGHARSQVMQKSCACTFLFGKATDEDDKKGIFEALTEKCEFHTQISLYRKNGSLFRCLFDIVPIKNRDKGVIMYLVSLKETNLPPIDSFKALQEAEEDFSDTKCVEKKDSWNSISESEQLSCMAGQRRRSRTVLYNLSGHIEGISSRSNNINRCTSISSMFSGNGRQMLEYETDPNKRPRFTFLHYSIKKTVWDWMILIFTLYVAAIVPYYAALQSIRKENFTTNGTNYAAHRNLNYCPTYVLDIFIEFIFIVDILLNFRTTFVNKMGQLVYEPKEIAINYLKSTFIIDLIAAIPFDFITHVISTNLSVSMIAVQILKTMRIFRVLKLYRKVETWSQYRAVVLFMLMFMFGMVAHWLACIWFSIGWTEFEKITPGPSYGTGWIFELSEAMHMPFYANKTGGPGIHSTYIASLYFTLSSLTSVGFGNVSANTNTEKTFSICVMIVGAIMHAVVFGSITAIIQRMYEKRSAYDRKERNLKDFIRAQGIPKKLKRQMIESFQGKWTMNKGVNERKILKEFPENIKADIAMFLHRELLNLPIFKDTSEGCRRFASLHASKRFASQNDILIHAGDPLKHVYLVCSGSLEVLMNDIVCAILSKGDIFGGDIASNVMKISRGNVKALTICELQCISLDGLQKITEMYPEHTDLNEALRSDFSCQLWEYILLNTGEVMVKETGRTRTSRIGSWNKHYNSEEQSDSDSSCVFYPAVTLKPSDCILGEEERTSDQETKPDGNAEISDHSADDIDKISTSLSTNVVPESEHEDESEQLLEKETKNVLFVPRKPVEELQSTPRMKHKKFCRSNKRVSFAFEEDADDTNTSISKEDSLKTDYKSKAKLPMIDESQNSISCVIRIEGEVDSGSPEFSQNNEISGISTSGTLSHVSHSDNSVSIKDCKIKENGTGITDVTALLKSPNLKGIIVKSPDVTDDDVLENLPPESPSINIHEIQVKNLSDNNSVFLNMSMAHKIEDPLTVPGKTCHSKPASVSSNNSNIRKRRRRKKFHPNNDEHENTSSITSDEARSAIERQRKEKRKSSTSDFTMTDRSPSRPHRVSNSDYSSEQNRLHLLRLEHKFGNMHKTVRHIAENVERILEKLSEGCHLHKPPSYARVEETNLNDNILKIRQQPPAQLCRQQSQSFQNLLQSPLEDMSPPYRSSSLDTFNSLSQNTGAFCDPRKPNLKTMTNHNSGDHRDHVRLPSSDFRNTYQFVNQSTIASNRCSPTQYMHGFNTMSPTHNEDNCVPREFHGEPCPPVQPPTMQYPLGNTIDVHHLQTQHMNKFPLYHIEAKPVQIHKNSPNKFHVPMSFANESSPNSQHEMRNTTPPYPVTPAQYSDNRFFPSPMREQRITDNNRDAIRHNDFCVRSNGPSSEHYRLGKTQSAPLYSERIPESRIEERTIVSTLSIPTLTVSESNETMPLLIQQQGISFRDSQNITISEQQSVEKHHLEIPVNISQTLGCESGYSTCSPSFDMCYP